MRDGGGNMEIKELGHVALWVRDMQKSLHFYRDVLGFRQIGGDGRNAAACATPRTHHELLLLNVGPDAEPVRETRRAGMYHFGLKVGDSDDELREALRQVQEAGTPIVGASDHTVTHSLYIQDPDGNEIELYIDVPGVDWKNNPQSIVAPIRPLAL